MWSSPGGGGEMVSRYPAVSIDAFWEPSAQPSPAPTSFSPSAHLSSSFLVRYTALHLLPASFMANKVAKHRSLTTTVIPLQSHLLGF